MRTLLILLLLTNPLSAQTKQPQPPPSKVFVKANDVDCETDRFRSRIVRQLKSRGLVVVDKQSDADFILLAELQHGTRPTTLTKMKVDVTLTRRDGNPFTTTTNWKSTTTSQSSYEEEVQKTAVKNIAELQALIKTVQIRDVIGVDRKALMNYVSQKGFRLVNSDADVMMSLKVEKNNVTEEEDYATVQTKVINSADDTYGGGNFTSSDAHFYFEPIDVIAAVAIKAADTVPLHPYRVRSR